MIRPRHQASGPRLPVVAELLLRALLPFAERDELARDLAEEYEARQERAGRARARAWVWWQVVRSAPSLARRGWWRGWSGFEAKSEGLQPGGAMLEEWGRDVRFALRRLRRRPWYTVLVVVTLALGVAGTSAVAGIARKLLVDPLPVRAEEEVVALWHPFDWSEAEFVSIRPEVTGFESLAAYRRADATLQVGVGPARLVRGISATAELFDVLGASPVLGPGFRRGDDVAGSEPVVVLSHGLWRELGGDPEIIGERLELAGEMRTVTGVMPPGFWYPDPGIQVWLAEALDPSNGAGNYALVGRMAGGATVASMAPHLERLTALLDERYDYPAQWDKTRNPGLTPLRDDLVGSMRPAILATLGAMAAILLIACVNVAALMLGQADSRSTELAVRGALGAGRARLLRQLVVESAVLGALAGVVGGILGAAGFRVLVAALPLGALAETARVGWGLFATAMLVAIGAATVVAAAPAISVGRRELQGRLSRGRTSGIGGRGGGLESGLVVAQVALVLLMVSGSALLIRSVDNLRAIETGVDVEKLAVVDVVLPTALTPEERARVTTALAEAVGALAGVESAAATQKLPLRGSGHNFGIAVEDRPDLESTTTAFRAVTADYFRTMGIRVAAGRGLEEGDRRADAEEGAVVINRALADRYFPGQDPLGRRIAFMNRWDRIVGIVENAAEAELSAEPVPARYMVYEQVPWLVPDQVLVLRVGEGRNPAALLDAARNAIRATAPGVAIGETTTMSNILARAIGPALQVMSLLTLLGALALTLGVIGVYGVVSHFVIRRRRDWGIRIALGIQPPRVVRDVVGRGGALVAAGIALGMAAFFALARVLTSFLYGVEPADAPSLMGATAILVVAGLLAALVPALRASHIDPAAVLREQ